MKNLLKLLAVLAFGFTVASCSRCYTCEAPVEIVTSSGTVEETQQEDFCTASPEELKAKEQDGYVCTNA